MNLITDEYRVMNTELHEKHANYGAVAAMRWVATIESLAKQYQSFDVLDYGCGKARLSRLLDKYRVKNYDPALEMFHVEPDSADIVVCTDVLEHVEPECLDDVLAHLEALTNRVLLLNIALHPSTRVLSDGRNAHLILESWDWWLEKIKQLNFNVEHLDTHKNLEITMILSKREAIQQ